jgi:uncharacterized phage-associated protein
MDKTTVKNVANYLIHLSSPGTSKGITHLKMQKLVFYAQALSYAINKQELFNEDFEAWVHGPVSPELYYAYKNFGSREIDKTVVTKPIFSDKDIEKTIKIIWSMYGDKDGKYLENKTHNEKPWQEARKNLQYYEHSNEIIKKDEIRDYYSKKFIVKTK